MVANPLLVSVPKLQIAVLPKFVAVPWLGLREIDPMPAGKMLVTWTPVAVVGPRFVTVSLNVMVPPRKAGLGTAAWLIPKSDNGLTVTLNCRVVVSWPPLLVPPLSLTVTVIVALPVAFVTGTKLIV